MPPFRMSRPTAVGPSLALALALAAQPALAQGTAEQRSACTGDAMRLCLSALPDVGRITACMKSHYGELSPRCQATFKESSPAAPPRKLAEEPAKAKRAEAPPVHREAPPDRREAERVAPRTEPKAEARIERRSGARAEARTAARETPAPRVAQRQRLARARLDRAPGERRFVPRPRDDEEAARGVAGQALAAAPYAAPLSPDAAPPYPDVASGAVPLAAPSRLPTGLSASMGSLAAACRDGLIDSYTCGHTIPALGYGE